MISALLKPANSDLFVKLIAFLDKVEKQKCYLTFGLLDKVEK